MNALTIPQKPEALQAGNDNPNIDRAGTPRTVVFDGEKAFWNDTRKELTQREYEDIFGMSKEDLVDYQEGEEDYLDYFAPYPEDEEDCPEDEGTTGRPSDPSSC